MSLVFIHSRLSTTLLLYLIIICLWGALRYIRNEDVNGSYSGALAIAEIIILVQGVIGLILYFMGLNPERGGMHILYGIVGALGIPAVYTYTKGRQDRKTLLIYVAVLLFNSGIFLRSMATG